MPDLVCFKVFDHLMEAELARNGLEHEGIYVQIQSFKGDKGTEYRLMGAPEDAGSARDLLESPEESQIPASAGETDPFKHEQAEAAKEFDEIREQDLHARAAGAKEAVIWAAGAAGAALICLVAIDNSSLSVRLALACLLFAVIQLFVWKDARAAQKELDGRKAEKES